MSVAGTWLWFDEVETGTKYNLGTYVFDKPSIISFASKYDPQPFHLDETAAANSHFGALCASGWHTAAAYMKCCAAYNFAACDSAKDRGIELPPLGPSPGFENMKWLKPVYVDDTITFHNEITSKREMASRADWGLVFADNIGINQNGETVFSFKGKLLVARR